MVSLIDKHRKVLIELCQKHYVKKLDVFGSAVTDDFDQASGIGLLRGPRRFLRFPIFVCKYLEQVFKFFVVIR